MRTFYMIGLICITIFLNLSVAEADTSVLMSRGDQSGTGANLAEVLLTPQSVSSGSFGKLASLQVEGFIFAQPLLVSNISVAGRVRNFLYVATMENAVYAFDADDFSSATGGLLWHTRLGSGGARPIPNEDIFSSNASQAIVKGNIGIMGTPVIDSSTNTIYLVARWKRDGVYGQSLHALDITTGEERLGSPSEIAFSDTSKVWTFDPFTQGQRAGLALTGANVVVAWGSLQDIGKYHGWVMAFDKTTLAVTGAFCSSCGPTTGVAAPFGAAFWQSGRAPVVDNIGYVYLFSGNGWPSGNTNGANYWASSCNSNVVPADYYGESVVKLNPSRLSNGFTLAPASGSVLPSSWCTSQTSPDIGLDRSDTDLGGSGPVLVTENSKNWLIGGGKDGILRVFDGNAITRFGEVGGAQLLSLNVAPSGGSCDHHIMGGPVYWNKSVGSAGAAPNSSLIFLSVENDYVRSYQLATSNSAPALTFKDASSDFINEHPGGILALSANSNYAGTGVLWMVHASNNPSCDFSGSAVYDVKLGTLRAYNADALSQKLWTSDDFAGRDSLGYFSKFTPPTVINGKVYVANSPPPITYDSSKNYTYYSGVVYSYIQVYGMNPPPAATVVQDNSLAVLPALRHEMQ